MKKLLAVVVVLAAAGGMFWYTRAATDDPAGAPGAGDRMAAGGRGGAGGGGFGMGGGFARMPMTVELASVTREPVSEELLVVGSLIGEATVDIAPKVSGRLEQMTVRLGDRVAMGQTIAQVEDREFQQQVRQVEASFAVAEATVRQREADLKFAETSLERSRNLFERQLVARQELDDLEARHQAALAQLDLARAQFEQARARLEELRITLANTRIVSPVNGFVGKRHVDAGAYVTPNVPVASVVDISTVRLVVNLVEKDLRRVTVGVPGVVEVDAFPGDTFEGRVGRVAPVLDPATRTAEGEIEIPNADFRLKPGMYARVRLTIGSRDQALVVPRAAVVNFGGQRGVFVYDGEAGVARFRPVETGLEDTVRAEIVAGLHEGEQVITTGAAGVSDGDRVLLPGETPAPPGAGRGGARAGGPPGAQDSAGPATAPSPDGTGKPRRRRDGVPGVEGSPGSRPDGARPERPGGGERPPGRPPSSSGR